MAQALAAPGQSWQAITGFMMQTRGTCMYVIFCVLVCMVWISSDLFTPASTLQLIHENASTTGAW
jgi:hypothetical protein